jgi:HYDIN/CFA65/VesB-like, Ig-like domain/von Willebrand factor type A domain
MACTPLNIQNGLFITSSVWSNAPSTSFDGKTLTLAAGGPNPGLSVQQGPNSIFHAQLANRSVRYQVLGNKFLVILDTEQGAGPSTRSVSLVNFATWTEVPILSVLASSNAVALPIVNPSQGNAAVFLAFGQNGTEHTAVAIHRSDNGDVLCSIGASIIPTGQTAAEATATNLIIHYNTANQSHTVNCPKPAGECQITPTLQTFADKFVGGCPFTPETKQFTIKNVGDDCLTVNSVTGAPPFSVQSTSTPLPAILGKNQTLTVTVAFNPTALGTFNSIPLPVSTTPASGDNQLVCNGKALAAAPKVSFSATSLNFGSLPVGTAAPPKAITITNTGSMPLSVAIPPLAASGFACAGFNGTLNCGASQAVAVSFTPPAEGGQSATLIVTTNAPGSPHTVTLSGAGCIANAEIGVPPAAPINFGQVQRGFRTVRLFEVQNTGDGPLTFTGTLSGADAALFGLPDPVGSVTNAPATRLYEALPVTPCGPGSAGSGKALVAISFFAIDPPKLASASLTLSGHNATNVPATQTWTFPLTAEIIPPVALDVGVVVDRSGSMTDSLGTRVKMDAGVSASQLLVELLRPNLDDRVAIVRFNEMPDVVVPMTPVTSAAAPTQADIRQKVATDIPPAAGATAIAGGALTGIKEIRTPRAAPPPALTRALVVLTDGIENRAFEDPPGSGNWFSLLGGQMSTPAGGSVTTSAMPHPADIDTYAIGLGKAGDISPTQLNALAGDPKHFRHVDRDLTGMAYFELEQFFTKIFMDIVDMAMVVDPMYWISPGDKHEIEFDVLRGDVDALVVLHDFEGLRLPFFCVSPIGEIIDPTSVPTGYQLRSGATSRARLVEFKMPLKEPDRYAGRWKVVVEHQGRVCTGMPDEKSDERGFLPRKCRPFGDPLLYGIAIGVGSNFRMTPFVTPGPVYVGDPILLTALVTEAKLPVTGCTVTVDATAPNGATWTLALFDDGAHADGAADDGEYAATFTHTSVEGTYHFRFIATGRSRDGEPVRREALRDKPVLRKGPPPDDHCCEKLLDVIQEQTKLLEQLLRPKS